MFLLNQLKKGKTEKYPTDLKKEEQKNIVHQGWRESK